MYRTFLFVESTLFEIGSYEFIGTETKESFFVFNGTAFDTKIQILG